MLPFPVLIFILTTSLIRCEQLTLKQIFQDSKAAVESNSTKENVDVLEKYYLTTIKDQSVWYLAVNEAKDVLGLTLDSENLQFIETLLKRISSHYFHCASLEEGPTRSQCFADIFTLLEDAEIGTKWAHAPEVEVDEKSKYGTLFNCIAAMSAHLSLITKDNLKYVKNIKDKGEKIKNFEHIIYRMIADLQGSNEYDYDLVEFRLGQVTPVEICDVNMHFWKEFTGNCETRWTIMANDQNKHKKVILRSNVAKSFWNNSDDVVIPDTDDDRDMVEDSGIDAELRLGNDIQPWHKRYRAQIYDVVNDKVLFQEYADTPTASRGDTLDKLTQKALDRRGKEELKVKNEIMKFINSTYYPNMKLLRTTLDILKS